MSSATIATIAQREAERFGQTVVLLGGDVIGPRTPWRALADRASAACTGHISGGVRMV
jgi:hypothetical protein